MLHLIWNDKEMLLLFFLLVFPLPNSRCIQCQFLGIFLPYFDQRMKIWQKLKFNGKTIFVFFFFEPGHSSSGLALKVPIYHILPPVVLFLRFLQWSHVAQNLRETWKSGRKFLFVIVYFCCLQKLSCLVFLFVLWDQIYSDLVVVFARPCPAPKID